MQARISAAFARGAVLGREAAEALDLDLAAGDELDGELALGGEGRVLEGLEATPIERVRGVGDQLAEEDLLVGVERVDHEVQQLLHFRLEFVAFHRLGSCGVLEDPG